MVGRSIISHTWYPAASEFLLVVKPMHSSRGQVPTWRARAISSHSISLTTPSLQVSFPLST